MKSRQKVLVIVGPTASGKSALAVELAKKFNGEVISADSRQVYKGLDIGTGKVTKAEMQKIPHYLLDISSPKKTVTAHQFAEKAREAIAKIASRGALPIVVGGTGFYIDALLGRISLPDVPPNKALRAKLQKKTADQLYAMLKKKDPARAKAMDTPSERNNKVRLVRALEVAGSTFSSASEAGSSLDPLWIGINFPEKLLEMRIRARLASRIKQGMIAEARRLHTEGLSYKRMEELGLEYRSLSRLLREKISRKEFEEELSRDIRRYAKKQAAYWKRNKDINWFDPLQDALMSSAVAKWLQ